LKKLVVVAMLEMVWQCQLGQVVVVVVVAAAAAAAVAVAM
jgi:hypothetical protein